MPSLVVPMNAWPWDASYHTSASTYTGVNGLSVYVISNNNLQLDSVSQAAIHAPVVISSLNPGDQVTLSVTNNNQSAGGGFGVIATADGLDCGYADWQPGAGSGDVTRRAASYYYAVPGQGPRNQAHEYFAGALIGAWTDGSGVLARTQWIGKGPVTVTCPSGATQLQLGTNFGFTSPGSPFGLGAWDGVTGEWDVTYTVTPYVPIPIAQLMGSDAPLAIDIPAPVDSGEDIVIDPGIMLRWSNDGGHSYGTELQTSLGQVGKNATRVRFNRLGKARDRVYELKITDPCRTRLISAFLDMDEGTN